MRNVFHKEDSYLLEDGLTKAERQEALNKFDRYFEERKPHLIGFQADRVLHYKDVLAKYVDF